MSLAERILVRLSRRPADVGVNLNLDGWTPDNALDNWRDVIPGFDAEIRHKTLLDFGCGLGFQAVALANDGAERVLAVDTNAEVLANARATVHDHALDNRITLKPKLEARDAGTFDIVLSHNSMEHFPQPAETLASMFYALKRGGKLLLTFGPPWFAPYGAHVQYFTPVPWVHLLFSERTVMSVRRRFRSDALSTYAPELNRMSIRKFEQLLARNKLDVEYRKYDCVKKLNALRALPWVRELFINRVTVIARK